MMDNLNEELRWQEFRERKKTVNNYSGWLDTDDDLISMPVGFASFLLSLFLMIQIRKLAPFNLLVSAIIMFLIMAIIFFAATFVIDKIHRNQEKNADTAYQQALAYNTDLYHELFPGRDIDARATFEISPYK